MFPNGEKPNAENIKEIMLAADTNEDGEVGRRRHTRPLPLLPRLPRNRIGGSYGLREVGLNVIGG